MYWSGQNGTFISFPYGKICNALANHIYYSGVLHNLFGFYRKFQLSDDPIIVCIVTLLTLLKNI